MTGVISITIKPRKHAVLVNAHAQTIDAKNIAVDFQGGVLGNRQDAVVRRLVPVMEQELELAA